MSLDDSHLNVRQTEKTERRIILDKDNPKESRFIVSYNNLSSEEHDVLARTLSLKEKKLLEQFDKWIKLEDNDIFITFKEIENE